MTAGDEEITWPFGLDESISYDGNRLKTAIRHANRRVLEAMRERPEYDGMATTVVAVLVDGDVANIAHVGDSRIYLGRGGELTPADLRPLLGQRADPGRHDLGRAGAHPPAAQRRDPRARRSGRAPRRRAVDPPRGRGRPAALLGRAHHHGSRRRHRRDPPRQRRRHCGAAQALVDEANARGGEDNITVVLGSGRRRAMTARGLPRAAARPRIGRYVVTGRIGRGGMGMVYRGLDEALEREVAVKTLKLEGSLDDESRRRFEVEAKAAARLQHPNIVTVYELGEDRGIPFIAMELLPGADLEALMRVGRGHPARREARDRRSRSAADSPTPTSAASSTATSSRATSGSSTTAPRRSWTSASPSSGA